MDAPEFYDALAADYDLIIDWPSRLKREAPLLREIAEETRAQTVLDVGGGTGHHARMLSEWGLNVTIADPSEATLDAVGETLPASVSLVPIGFDGLDELGQYDLVICLGNTIPHVATKAEFAQAIAALYARVAPGGSLLIHQLNYAPVLAGFERERYLGPSGREGRFFLRFFERAGEHLRFVMMRVDGVAGEYEAHFTHTLHLPVGREDYLNCLESIGVSDVNLLGGWDGIPYTDDSDVLIARGRRPSEGEPAAREN